MSPCQSKCLSTQSACDLRVFRQHKHTRERKNCNFTCRWLSGEAYEDTHVPIKAHRCMSIVECAQCGVRGWQDRLVDPKEVKVHGNQQKLREVVPSHIFCDCCSGSLPKEHGDESGERIIIEKPRSEDMAVFGHLFLRNSSLFICTIYWVCECRECKRFSLAETRTHHLHHLGSHSKDSGNVRGDRQRCPCPQCNPRRAPDIVTRYYTLAQRVRYGRIIGHGFGN